MSLRPRLLFAFSGLLVLGGGTAWLVGRARPLPTPTPSEVDFHRFVLAAQEEARRAIARREAARVRKPGRVPLAIAPADGVALSAPAPPGSGVVPDGAPVGQFCRDGYYLAPPTSLGRTIDRLRYEGAKPRELLLVLAGPRGIGAQKVPQPETPVFLDGPSLLRDEGAMIQTDGVYRLPAEGLERVSLGIVQPKGPPPHRVALAPAEWPGEVRSEPGGYALVFDQATVWRLADPVLDVSQVVATGMEVPIPFLGPWLAQRRPVGVREEWYRAVALAHLYVRSPDADEPWRYARSYILQGEAEAFFSEDERYTAGFSSRRGQPIRRFGLAPAAKVSIAALEP